MCVRACECNQCYKRATCTDCTYIPDKVDCGGKGVSECPHRVPYPSEVRQPAEEE